MTKEERHVKTKKKDQKMMTCAPLDYEVTLEKGPELHTTPKGERLLAHFKHKSNGDDESDQSCMATGNNAAIDCHCIV